MLWEKFKSLTTIAPCFLKFHLHITKDNNRILLHRNYAIIAGVYCQFAFTNLASMSSSPYFLVLLMWLTFPIKKRQRISFFQPYNFKFRNSKFYWMFSQYAPTRGSPCPWFPQKFSAFDLNFIFQTCQLMRGYISPHVHTSIVKLSHKIHISQKIIKLCAHQGVNLLKSALMLI
jgi:hypothetical protein